MEKLAAALEKMKHVYDRQPERRKVSPGDQVLALLPFVGSLCPARFTGPHTVVKQTAENYLIPTPDHRTKTQLWHVNLLRQ